MRLGTGLGLLWFQSLIGQGTSRADTLCHGAMVVQRGLPIAAVPRASRFGQARHWSNGVLRRALGHDSGRLTADIPGGCRHGTPPRVPLPIGCGVHPAPVRAFDTRNRAGHRASRRRVRPALAGQATDSWTPAWTGSSADASGRHPGSRTWRKDPITKTATCDNPTAHARPRLPPPNRAQAGLWSYGVRRAPLASNVLLFLYILPRGMICGNARIT